jgi:glycosyltransferase involved in cell wall biosynthesis
VRADFPKVTVLLATFNGARFLEEQLTSLIDQEEVDIEVLVNDDGSTDGTLEILEYWKARGLVASISHSIGLGATKAFLNLLQTCEEKDFVAFCDQDDVWNKDKLITQIHSVRGDMPAMSTGMRMYINEKGEYIGKSKYLKKPPSFENAIFENIAPGNTTLLNNPAIKLVNKVKNPSISHYDAWIYLLLSAFGKVIFIPSYLMKYRIHSNNAVGLRTSSIPRARESLTSFFSQMEFFTERYYSLISPEQKIHLNKLRFFRKQKNLRNKIRFLSSIDLARQSDLDGVILKLLMLSER